LRLADREAGPLDERAVDEGTAGRDRSGGAAGYGAAVGRADGRASRRHRTGVVGLTRRGPVLADAEVRPQSAPLGLIANVNRDHPTGAPVEVLGALAALHRLAAVKARGRAHRHAAVAGPVFGLNTHIAAQLQAGIGARNVVEAVAVERADFHV